MDQNEFSNLSQDAKDLKNAVGWMRNFFKGSISIALLGHVGIMAYIVPKFHAVYEQMDMELPVTTQYLMSWSSAWWVYLLVAVVNIALILQHKIFNRVPVLLAELLLIGIYTAFVYLALIVPYFNLIGQVGN